MAKAKRRSFERQYLQVPNETATAPEIKTPTHAISLEALGLIVNICSYSEEWELHKLELYKRFEKNKRTSVSNAWKELTEAKYIFEYKYRNGKKWEHVYLYDIIPYTDEQIEILRLEAIEEYGEIWDVDFVNPKMDTPKCAPQNQHLINTKETKNEKDKKLNKKSFVNKEENQNVSENYFSKGEMLETADKFYSEFAAGRWGKNQWFIITDKLTTEIFDRCIAIRDLDAYIYSALKQIAYKHDYKYGKVEFKFENGKGEVPFYDWLNNWDMEDL